MKNRNNSYNNEINATESQERAPYIAIPYVEKFNEDILSYSLKKFGMKVVYRLSKKLNTIMRTGKDVLSNEFATNVVYKIDCNDCSASNIGQTKRHLITRI